MYKLIFNRFHYYKYQLKLIDVNQMLVKSGYARIDKLIMTCSTGAVIHVIMDIYMIL